MSLSVACRPRVVFPCLSWSFVCVCSRRPFPVVRSFFPLCAQLMPASWLFPSGFLRRLATVAFRLRTLDYPISLVCSCSSAVTSHVFLAYIRWDRRHSLTRHCGNSRAPGWSRALSAAFGRCSWGATTGQASCISPQKNLSMKQLHVLVFKYTA